MNKDEIDKLIEPDKKLEQINLVLDLARKTNPVLAYQTIGDLVGLTRQRVSQICLEHGIVRRPQDVVESNWIKHWEKLDDDDKEQRIG